MFEGFITGYSEVVEWKIPDFFSIVHRYYIDSPPFLLAGCRWYLRLYPKSLRFTGYVSAEIYIDDTRISDKTSHLLTAPQWCTLGLKTAYGTVEERVQGRSSHYTSRKTKESSSTIAFLKISDLQKRKPELMKCSSLTVTCRAVVEFPTSEEVAPKLEEVCTKQTMLVELETLSSDLSDLLSGDRKYDVTIDVQGTEFRAHRIVLSARSSVFRAMYEHDTAEARSGVLTIPDCDPDSFHDFLRYLYTGKMEEVSFQTAYHLYATAEKYNVQTLKSFCTNYLTQNLTPENLCVTVCLADKYCDDALMSSAQAFFNKNSCNIFLTSEWSALLLNNPSLSDKLLKAMATVSLKALEE